MLMKRYELTTVQGAFFDRSVKLPKLVKLGRGGKGKTLTGIATEKSSEVHFPLFALFF